MKSLIFSVVLTILAAVSFANTDESNSSKTRISLQQIIENKESCVQKFLGNKIYLKSDSLIYSENNVFLSLNETRDISLLPPLSFDENGFFIKSDLLVDEYECTPYQVKKECQGCGEFYIGHCKNPNCILKKRK